MKKTWLSLLAALCFTIILLPATAEAMVVDGGKCGANAAWTLTDDGVLTISGTGEMENFALKSGSSLRSKPWEQWKSSICEVNITEGITTVGDGAFASMSISKVSLPASLDKIGISSFSRCTSLRSISLPDNLTTICNGAFSECTSLSSITIPDDVTQIGDVAFDGCSNLSCINLSDSFVSIGLAAFRNCTSLESITLPSSLVTISDFLFSNCSSLSSITIPDKVSSIGDYAFSNCTNLKNVLISNNVASIGYMAFYQCSSLETIVIPDSVATIGNYAFKDCSILAKVAFIGDYPIIGEDCFQPTILIAYYPCGNDTWAEETLQELTEKHPTVMWTVGHFQRIISGKAATCTSAGLTEGKAACGCGKIAAVKQQPIAKLAHNYEKGVCTVCNAKAPDYKAVDGVGRIYGSSRYDTAFQSADPLKKQMGVEKFSCAIVTSGDNFADALAGSYLAYVKNAPILLTDNDNIGDVMGYIQKNVEKGATVYALGGKAVVTDKLFDLEKKGYEVKRLAGKSRFETNLEILKECGSVAGKDILVCTGFNFADSLSASAAKRPILLVDDKLTDEQKAYLKQQSGCKYCIVGGTGAVTNSVEKSLKSYGSVSRLAGSNRFETSVMVAKKFMADPTPAVLAYGYNFPDGLCAGPLAATMDAPLILTATGDEAQAAVYAKEGGIKDGYVLGGSALINDKAVKKIFSMDENDKIQ